MSFEGSDREAGIGSAIIPDAYEVSITLTDMVIPSKNMFQQINIKKVHTRMLK